MDIGAEYGSTAAFFLEKGARKIIAVEADPALFHKLASNFHRNRKVIPIRLKVSAPDDIEDLIRRYRPDALKADCEGCEIHLAKVSLKSLTTVPEYMIETHSHIGLETRPFIEKLFRKLGYVYADYEVLPNVHVLHAKKRWDKVAVSENEIVDVRNLRILAADFRALTGNLKLDPLSLILYLYGTRPDLQKAYPEVRDGDYHRLFQWAYYVTTKRTDRYELLSRYESWYRSNPFARCQSYYIATRDLILKVLWVKGF